MQGPGRIVQFLEHLLVLAERVGAKSVTRTCGMSIFGRMHGMHKVIFSRWLNAYLEWQTRFIKILAFKTAKVAGISELI
jgi:hypothetical protein